jgi:hypothetical protein
MQVAVCREGARKEEFFLAAMLHER